MVAAPRLELGIGGYEPPRLPLPHATIKCDTSNRPTVIAHLYFIV